MGDISEILKRIKANQPELVSELPDLTLLGSQQFDVKLKNGLFPELKHEVDFISSTIFKKGISVYRYVKG